MKYLKALMLENLDRNCYSLAEIKNHQREEIYSSPLGKMLGED